MKGVAMNKDKEMKDKVEYVERKLIGKGIHRLERHPADGLPLKHDPKKGHGGKFSWEGHRGPEFLADLDAAAPPAIDEKDPNYVDDEKDGGGDEVAAELVVGEIETPKVAEEGVARIEVRPPINLTD